VGDGQVISDTEDGLRNAVYLFEEVAKTYNLKVSTVNHNP
jgi:hypothetical protein